LASKIWHPKEGKVFLANFNNSLMIRDVKEKYSEIHQFWRRKTYVKDEDKLLPSYLREFPEPYQVAQYYCGGTWNDYNSPFTIQIGFCNLDCFWCFVSDELKNGTTGRFFSAKEIINIWATNEDKGILRLSGGEPFLAPDFIIELGKEIRKCNNSRLYLWIDTNLLGTGYERVVKKLSTLDIPFGICGCFKGFDEKDFEYNTRKNGKLFYKQFINAKEILNNLGKKGELFFYIPEILEKIKSDEIENKIFSLIELLTSKIHPLAPLRTTILYIKEYEINKEKMHKQRLESGLTRRKWFEILEQKYPLNLRWLPQHQINIK